MLAHCYQNVSLVVYSWLLNSLKVTQKLLDQLSVVNFQFHIILNCPFWCYDGLIDWFISTVHGPALSNTGQFTSRTVDPTSQNKERQHSKCYIIYLSKTKFMILVCLITLTAYFFFFKAMNVSIRYCLHNSIQGGGITQYHMIIKLMFGLCKWGNLFWLKWMLFCSSFSY